MRIGLLTSSLSQAAGGLLDATRLLAEQLQAIDGIEVSVFGTSDDLYRAADWSGIDTHALTVSGPIGFRYSPHLVPALMNAKLDLIHTIGLWSYATIACNRWHRKTGRPFVVAPHGMLEPWAMQNHALRKKIAIRTYQGEHFQRSACILALNKTEVANIHRTGFEQTRVISNGVELPSSDSIPSVEWEGPIAESDTVFLYLGRLDPKKNLINLINAFGQSDALQNKHHLVIAGEGAERYVQSLITHAHGKANIHLVGGQYGDAKARCFQRADAFILPSLSEGQPIAALEALASGTPILISEESNLPEAENCGAAISCGTEVEQIRNAINTFLNTSHEARIAMGTKGQSLCDHSFSWKETARLTSTMYQNILGTSL